MKEKEGEGEEEEEEEEADGAAMAEMKRKERDRRSREIVRGRSIVTREREQSCCEIQTVVKIRKRTGVVLRRHSVTKLLTFYLYTVNYVSSVIEGTAISLH